MTPTLVHGLGDAVSAIITLIDGRSCVLGLTGPVGAGKSTLASMIQKRVGAALLATDRYLPDYDVTAEADRDHPESSDLELLAQHVGMLASGSAVDAPVWCFQEHKRAGTDRIDPGSHVVIEGLHAFAPPAGELLDLAIYIEAEPADRLARWDAIESAGERGMGVDRAREFFHKVAEPTFATYADAYRQRADLVVINSGRPASRPA